jgi:hypothetical protein
VGQNKPPKWAKPSCQTHTLRRAQLEGELDAHTDIESLADFFDSTLAGMRIAAKAGKTRPALKRIAVVASIVFAGTKLSIL